MRPDFYPIYRDLYERYVREHSGEEAPRQLLSEITGAIDRAAAYLQLGERFRPDARLFLLINLHQMVLLPLARASAIPPEFRDSLNEDVQAILRRALENGGREISGHAVLKAVDQLWKVLRMTPGDGAWDQSSSK